MSEFNPFLVGEAGQPTVRDGASVRSESGVAETPSVEPRTKSRKRSKRQSSPGVYSIMAIKADDSTKEAFHRCAMYAGLLEGRQVLLCDLFERMVKEEERRLQAKLQAKMK